MTSYNRENPRVINLQDQEQAIIQCDRLRLAVVAGGCAAAGALNGRAACPSALPCDPGYFGLRYSSVSPVLNIQCIRRLDLACGSVVSTLRHRIKSGGLT